MISNRFNAETKYLILEILVAVHTHTDYIKNKIAVYQ